MHSAMPLLNESGRWLVAQLGRMSMELAILAGVVLLALYVLRVKSPALRHLFWGLLLAKPVLTFLVASPLSLYAFLWPPTPEVFFTQPPAVVQTAQPSLPLPAAPPPEMAPAAVAPRVEAPPLWRQVDRYGLAMLAWGLVASLLGLRLLLGCAYVAFLRGTARTQREGVLADFVTEAAATLRVRRHVAIATTTVCHGPVLAGIFRPVILLPESMAAALTEAQLKLIITHELAHARRWDNLVLLVQRLAEMLFFFHPVVWLCGWMMRREAEAACDDMVVSAYGDADGAGAAAYADSLTRVAEMKCGITRRLLVNTFAAAESNFHRRIRRILSGKRTRMTLWLSLATGAALILIGVLGLPAASAPKDRDIPSGTYATPEGGYTHLVTFEPAGDFHPGTPRELLDVFNGVCRARTGYFRTAPEDGKLVGRICTDAPEELQKSFEKEPRLKWVESVPLTAELFAQQEASKQESLPENSASAAPHKAEMIAMKLRVVDETGAPVSGATVRPYALRTSVDPGSHYGWRPEDFGESRETACDAQGDAQIDYPQYVEENKATNKVTVVVTHPEFVVKHQDLSVDEAAPVISLTHGTKVRASGYMGAKENAAWPVHVLADSTAGFTGDRWQENGKALENGQFTAGKHQLWLIHQPKDGLVLFSDLVSFETSPDKVTELAVELHPGIRVEGRIDDTVPRPVRNGRVEIFVASVPPDETDGTPPSCVQYSAQALMGEDGRFVFDSLPKGHAEIAAWCDGSIVSYTGGKGNAFLVHPLPVDLTAPPADIVVPMVTTASATVTAHDTQGNPIEGIKVSFWPNIQWMGRFTNVAAPSTLTSLQMIGMDEKTIEAAYVARLKEQPYTATTGPDGLATVTNLPPCTHQFLAANDAYQLPLNNAPMPRRYADIKLTPGGNTAVTVQLEKKQNTAEPAKDQPAGEGEKSSAAYKTPEGGYTHLVTFMPAGDFYPRKAEELLDVFNGVCKAPTGYYRTLARNGLLTGLICTTDPEAVQKALEKEPRLKWVKTEALTPELFAAHKARTQYSLPEKSDIEKILSAPVSIEFENIHLSEIVQFMSDSYDINIDIDYRAVAPPKPSPASVPGPDRVTDGKVPYINLKNIQMREALNALLRPLNLAFKVESSMVWISSPALIEADAKRPQPDVHSASESLAKTLACPVAIEFENIHLVEIAEFISDSWDVNIVLDQRVIPPKPKKSGESAPVSSAYVTDGNVARINVWNMPLSDVLHALLRPLNLTFKAEKDMIWVSSDAMIKAGNTLDTGMAPASEAVAPIRVPVATDKSMIGGLLIDSLELHRKDPASGEVVLVALLRNADRDEVSPLDVEFYLDVPNPKRVSRSFAPFPAGATHKESADFALSEGANTLVVVLDPEAKLTCIEPDRKCARLTVDYRDGKLSVRGVQVGPDTYQWTHIPVVKDTDSVKAIFIESLGLLRKDPHGNEVTLLAHVRNATSWQPYELGLEFYLDGPDAMRQKRSMEALAAGTLRRESATFTLAEGHNTLVVLLDPEHQCPEVNEKTKLTKLFLDNRNGKLSIKGVVRLPDASPESAKEQKQTAAADTAQAAALPPIAARDFVAALPDGRSIQVVSVHEHKSDNKAFWRPDGTALTESPYDPDLTKEDSVAAQGKVYEFAFQSKGLQADVPMQYIFEGSPGWGMTGSSDHPGLNVATVFLDDNATVENISVNVASGDWTTLITEEPQGGSARGLQEYALIFGATYEKDGAACITVTMEGSLVDQAVRLCAMDAQGQLHPSTANGAGAGKTKQTTHRFEGLKPADIKEFQLQTRPWQEFRFNNISLVSGRHTDVEIVVAPTPGGAGEAAKPANAAPAEAPATVSTNAPATDAVTATNSQDNVAEGAVELDHDIVLPLAAWVHDPPSNAPRIKFTLNDHLFHGVVHLTHGSWPHTQWRARLELLNADGKAITDDEEVLQNTGIIYTYPLNAEADLKFAASDDKTAEAKRFRFSVETDWTQTGETEFRFAEDMPLALSLDTPACAAVVSLKGIRIDQTDTGCMAKCWTQYLPSPKMKWQIYVSLISEKGKTLGRATQLCENSGESTSVGSNVSIRRTDELEFTPTGEPIELKQAKRFFVKLEGASISEASSPPQKEQTNKPEEMVQHHDPAVVPVSTSPAPDATQSTVVGKPASGPLVVAPLIGFLDDKTRADWQAQGISGDMAVLSKLQDQTIEIMQKRLDRAGMKDVKISKEANGRIAGQIPPSIDAARAGLLLTQPGMSRFCPAASRDEVVQILQEAEKDPRFHGRATGLFDTKSSSDFLTVLKDKHDAAEAVLGEINDAQPRLLPEGKMFFVGSKCFPDTLYLLDKNSPMANVKVQSASAVPDTDNPGKARINFAFSDEDAQRFGDLTESSVGKGLAILINWEVQSVPIVRSKITKSGQITGNYTLEEATDIAARMSVPEYPVQLIVLSDPTATPATPAPAKVEDVREALETRYYAGIDQGLLDRLLGKFLVPVFDPDTGEKLSLANYDKAKGELCIRNLPDNLAAFERMLPYFGTGKKQMSGEQSGGGASQSGIHEDFERHASGPNTWPDGWVADGNASNHDVCYVDGTTFKETHGNTLRLHGDTPAWSPLAHFMTKVNMPFQIAFDVYLESKDPKCTCVVGVRKEPSWKAPGMILFDTIPPGVVNGLEPVAEGGEMSGGQTFEQLHMEPSKWYRVELAMKEEGGRQTLSATLNDGTATQGPVQLTADAALVKDMPYLQLEVRSGTAWYDNVSMEPLAAPGPTDEPVKTSQASSDSAGAKSVPPQYTAELRLLAGTQALVESFCAQLGPGRDIAHGPEVEQAFSTNNAAGIEAFFKANEDTPDLELLSAPRATFKLSEDPPVIPPDPWKRPYKLVMRTRSMASEKINVLETIDRYSESFRKFCEGSLPAAIVMDALEFVPAVNEGNAKPMQAGMVMALNLSKTDAPDQFGVDLYVNNKEVHQASRGLAFWKPIPPPEVFESPIVLRLDKKNPYKMGDWIVAVTRHRAPEKATLAVLHIEPAPPNHARFFEATS